MTKLLKGILKRIITSEIFEDSKNRVSFYKYLLIGLFLRFLFIPFFFQIDILSSYTRAAGQLFETIPETPAVIQLVMHWLHVFFLKIVVQIIPNLKTILSIPEPHPQWLAFISNNQVFRMLSVIKFPYFIFDLACAFLLLRFTKDARTNLKVFKHWMINPIVIFVTYIFARFDVIPLFITLLALYFAMKDKKYISIFLLVISIVMRFFPVLILPFLIIYLAKNKKDYIIFSLLGISGLLALEIGSRLISGSSALFKLLNSQHFTFLIALKWGMEGLHVSLIPLVIFFTLTIISFFEISNKSFSDLLKYSLIAFLLWFSFGYYHPQYLLWAIPFLIFQFIEKDKIFYYHLLQILIIPFILLYWGQLVTSYLFTPIDSRYFVYFPDIVDIIRKYYTPSKFANIFSSIFSGVSIWIIYEVYKLSKIKSNLVFNTKK
ncbi:MAG: hypothetical protein KAV97_01125 [Actinomycetia bacterium]|nr:hypothetical protein [Actinomycetes bacterium]